MSEFLKKRWKWIVGFIICVGILAGWQRYAAAQSLAVTITTQKAKKTDFTKTLTSSGKTKADKAVDLKFQTSGKLSWVKVKEGDTVLAYQALAGLDIREVQKTLEKALRDYSSERNDFDQSSLDSPAYKPSDAANDTVRRILEKNQWDLEKAVLDVELKHLAVEYSTLVTPIAGIVTHIDTPVPGINITPATAVFSVADPSSVIFEATVDETDITNLSIGQKATIMLDAYPDTSFTGTISYISYVAQQSSGGSTVFPVKISIDSGNTPIRIGLNGDIEIITEQTKNALVIPTESLREDDDGQYVFRKNDGSFKKVRVKPGSRNEDVVVIISGLSEGDLVVTKGFSSIPK